MFITVYRLLITIFYTMDTCPWPDLALPFLEEWPEELLDFCLLPDEECLRGFGCAVEGGMADGFTETPGSLLGRIGGLTVVSILEVVSSFCVVTGVGAGDIIFGTCCRFGVLIVGGGSQL